MQKELRPSAIRDVNDTADVKLQWRKEPNEKRVSDAGKKKKKKKYKSVSIPRLFQSQHFF